MLEEGFLDLSKPLIVRRGSLPHWRQDGALYFVTFRLSDSLPQVLLRQWQRDQDVWTNRHPNPSRDEQMQWSIEQRRRVERWLDRGYGSCVLRDPRAGHIVEDAFRFFDGTRYELGDLTVAPNHVHTLLRTALAVDLSDVLYSLKRYKATALLKMPRIREAFTGCRHLWQVESFDHIVRNGRSLEKIRAYIREHDRPTNASPSREQG